MKFSSLKFFRRYPTATKIKLGENLNVEKLTRVLHLDVLKKMALLKYLKPIRGLSDPKGSLSATILSPAISEANKQVERELQNAASHKRGPYLKLDSSLRCLLFS